MAVRKLQASTRRAVLAGAAALALPYRSAFAAERLRLGHGLPASHPVHLGMERFSATLRERSGGAFDLQIFPNGQIGEELDLIQQAKAGKLDFVKASATVLEASGPLYKVFNLPFLLRDKAHWRAVVEGPIGEGILASTAEAGLVGLTFYDAGARSFYGNRPMEHPNDLIGLKIRVQPSRTMTRMIELFDAKPVTMAWGVVYDALRTRLIDGAENNLTALTHGRHGEVVKHYAFDEHTIVPDVLLASASLWQRLTPSQRDLFREAARTSFAFQADLWAKEEAAARAQAEGMGVYFTSPDKKPFMARVAVMKSEMAEDPALAKLIARIETV